MLGDGPSDDVVATEVAGCQYQDSQQTRRIRGLINRGAGSVHKRSLNGRRPRVDAGRRRRRELAGFPLASTRRCPSLVSCHAMPSRLAISSAIPQAEEADCVNPRLHPNRSRRHCRRDPARLAASARHRKRPDPGLQWLASPVHKGGQPPDRGRYAWTVRRLRLAAPLTASRFSLCGDEAVEIVEVSPFVRTQVGRLEWSPEHRAALW